MNKAYSKRNPRNSAGFTMLEAMIALLVLSIGLLGLAGLQTTSARLTGESYQRSITTLAASEIIDKIRMRTGKQERSIRAATIASYVSTAPAGSCVPTASDIASELACWQASIQNELPAGAGTITNGGNGFVTVRISWENRDTGATESIDWKYMVGGP
jgi:type IV pilus assembly protein PilV